MAGLATFASPLMRWAMLREDHPGATFAYSEALGRDLPGDAAMPEDFGADDRFCLATITFPPESGIPEAHGYKRFLDGVNGKGNELKPVETPEQLLQLRTKCLGRALARCGYPSDVDDLRFVIRYRKELARLEAIIAGVSPDTLKAIESSGGSGDMTAIEALSKAAKTSEDADDDIVDGEIVDSAPAAATPVGPPPTDDQIQRVRDFINAAQKAKVQPELRGRARDEGISFATPETEEQALRVIAIAEELGVTLDQEATS